MTSLVYHRAMDALRHLTLLLALTFATTGAQAQLVRLPSLNLPPVDRLGSQLGTQLGRPLDHSLVDLSRLRLDTVTQLLRSHRRVLEADPRGEPVVRRQVLAYSPSAQSLAAAVRAGFSVVRTQQLDGLDETLVTLEAPADVSTDAALRRLREADPQGVYDFNHIYTRSGGSGRDVADPVQGVSTSGTGEPVRIGLLDGGVASRHPVFAASNIQRHGCGGREIPSMHGTGVAALMVGRDGAFNGVAPGGQLFAADIYCDSPDGGSAERIAAALAWLAKERVAVINLSIVGPPNITLERLVAALVRRGHLLVAAAGNDGPAAAPLYPAAYPGVVGVTAVGRDGKVLPEAARGSHVMFAAPGATMATAASRIAYYQSVRGTSFAAPVVSALISRHLAQPDIKQAKAALAAIAKDAVKTEDAGLGLVGMAFRSDPKKISRLME